MCGFLVAPRGHGHSRYIARRGPDGHSILHRDGWTFQHWLLNITGPATFQPFTDGAVIALYNGELYNRPYARSDGETIIPAYREAGRLFPQLLDGEFAIALYDFPEDLAYFVTDRFATKPIWRNGAACASYESGVGGEKVPANRIETVRISTGELLNSVRYHAWRWLQTVRSYDACLEALETAILKRYTPQCFIGLSSGYDSGTIACALHGRNFKAYMVPAAETRQILQARAAVVANVEVLQPDLARHAQWLEDEAEDFRYMIEYDDGIGRSSYKQDYAARALSAICEAATQDGRRVYLSGSGADEILSDYSLIPKQSLFKGTFPDPLRIWPNFTGSCMYSYLGKEELVGGSWGVETRYPFLDTTFVQSFLSLHADLKNRHYKAPLYEYLTAHGFPFEVDRKIGWALT